MVASGDMLASALSARKRTCSWDVVQENVVTG